MHDEKGTHDSKYDSFVARVRRARAPDKACRGCEYSWKDNTQFIGCSKSLPVMYVSTLMPLKLLATSKLEKTHGSRWPGR